MDAVKEDIMLAGVREEDANDKMEINDSALKGTEDSKLTNTGLIQAIRLFKWFHMQFKDIHCQ